jgi:hypothetical protein
MLRNEPETIIDGHIGTQGYIKYFFRAFGAVAVLCIERRLRVGNDDERLKIIAQVIAECDGKPRASLAYVFCSWPECTGCNLQKSTRGLPVHCIFTDGLTYEFFKFERNPNPSFRRGCFPGDPDHLQRGLKVPNYSFMTTTLPFILQLRCACETIFDMMLNAYIASLKVNYVRLEEKGRKQGLKTPSLDGWDQALQSANRALAGFREAEVQRKDGDLDSADATVDQALLVLQERYRFYFHLQSDHSFLTPSLVQEQCQLYTDLNSSRRTGMMLRSGRHEVAVALCEKLTTGIGIFIRKMPNWWLDVRPVKLSWNV